MQKKKFRLCGCGGKKRVTQINRLGNKYSFIKERKGSGRGMEKEGQEERDIVKAFSGSRLCSSKRQKKEKKKRVEQDETSDLKKKNQNMKTLADQKNGTQPLEKTAGS